MNNFLQQFIVKLQLNTAVNDDGYLVCAFENAPLLLIKQESASYVLFCCLGQAPVDATHLLEAMLSANLFWRDTAGATLSLEPHSRNIIFAEQFSQCQFENYNQFEVAVLEFVQYTEYWQKLVVELKTPVADSASDITSNFANTKV